MEPATHGRWLIAAAAALMQLALGAIYAWSVFRDPLVDRFDWTISQVTLAYTINLLTLGFASFLGGLWMAKVGPRMVGITGGVLYGSGLFLTSFADDRLWLLYLAYGFVGGFGRGLAWIVPVATVVKWFPDKRGMITGLAVAGNGVGALLTAPLATALIIEIGVLPTFAILGGGFVVVVIGMSLLMRNPPDGYRPAGWQPSAAQMAERATREYTIGEALRTPQWYALWALLLLNGSAGLAVLSQAASMAREITGVSVLVGAGVVGILSVANAVGRFAWAWLSDGITRRWTFLAMFLLQAAVLALVPLSSDLGVFTALLAVVLLCFGGGVGTMPPFAADYFGAKHVGAISGLLMTGQGFGAILGPMLIATIREATGEYTPALYSIALIMLASAVVPFLIRPPTPCPEVSTTLHDRRPATT